MDEYAIEIVSLYMCTNRIELRKRLKELLVQHSNTMMFYIAKPHDMEYCRQAYIHLKIYQIIKLNI